MCRAPGPVPVGAATRRVNHQPEQHAVQRDEEDGCRDPGRGRRPVVAPPPEHARLRGERDERDERERDAEREHDLAEHERERGVEAEPQDRERRDERDQPAEDERDPHVQQAVHDLGAGVGADRRRREPEASSPTANSVAMAGPSATLSAAYAPSRVSVPSTPERFTAASSRMQRFTVPAIAIAIVTSHRVARRAGRSARPSRCRRELGLGDPCLADAEPCQGRRSAAGAGCAPAGANRSRLSACARRSRAA